MADTAVCPAHPTEAAIGNCTRCGAFMCRLDSRELDGTRYCEPCAARPDVDWLEGFKRARWGKRDGWAWLFGIGALPQAALGIRLLLEPASRPMGLFPLLAAVGGALWWLKVRAARWLLVAVLIAQVSYFAATIHPVWLLGGILPLIILLAVVLSTRTKLFFELDVPRERVKSMWDVYANNVVARYAVSLGVVGLVVWPFAPLAILCGAIGLSRVDPGARPPIGRKGSAMAGIILGLMGMAVCAIAIANGFR